MAPHYMEWGWCCLEKIERKERVGASWRDLESAHVKARIEELLYVDSVNEDSSVGEFLDANNWKMTAVRLPYDHVLGRKLSSCKNRRRVDYFTLLRNGW